MEKYICITELQLPKYDENEEVIEGEFSVVQEGSIWTSQGNSSLADIRLVNNESWIEITEEHFAHYFKSMQ